MAQRGTADSMGFAVSAGEVLKFEALFRLFDRDGDGQLDIQEVGDLLPRIGEELRRLFDCFDEDKSGTMEFPEFLHLMVRHKQATQLVVHLVVRHKQATQLVVHLMVRHKQATQLVVDRRTRAVHNDAPTACTYRYGEGAGVGGGVEGGPFRFA
eukprot:gene40864-23014_t